MYLKPLNELLLIIYSTRLVHFEYSMEHSGNVESLKDRIILYITGGEFAMP